MALSTSSCSERGEVSHIKILLGSLVQIEALERGTGSFCESTDAGKDSQFLHGGTIIFNARQAQRPRLRASPSPPPRRLSFCKEDSLLPETAVESILDFLSVPQALAMIARSRSPERGLQVSRYCLSRLDKMVTNLAMAEEAYHHVRKTEEADEQKAGPGSSAKRKGNAAYTSARFLQLGDLKYLDVIYKRALQLAVSNGGRHSVPGLYVTRMKKGGEHAAVHVRRVGQRLMELLATGMLSNLTKRHAEDQGESGASFTVGIVTDCMHPSTAGNRSFSFKHSVDTCGLLRLSRFPLVAVAGICVIDTASPIFLCLPKVQSTPIRFTPASKSKWLRRTVEWNQGVRGAAAPKGPGGAAEGEPGWHTNDESVEGSQEIQSTGIRPSSDFKISAVLAQAFESACGRYDAGLIGLQLLRASDDGGEEREAGATWPVDGLNDSSSIISNDEIGPQILFMGLRPCGSRFCRSWNIKAYTLVIFGDSEELCDSPIVSASNGKWKFTDTRRHQVVYQAWSRSLGMQW